MRSVYERVRLAQKIARQKVEVQRKRTMYGLSALFVVLVAGLGVKIAGIMHGVRGQVVGMAGSTLVLGEVSDYVMVSLVAFAAGVTITVICVKIQAGRNKSRDEIKENDEPDNDE